MPILSPHRATLAISGDDRFTFLQGLITNDINIAKNGQPLYACLLTAQGKFLHDFLIIPDGDRLLLTPEAERLLDLKKRLTMYKLRSKVTLEELLEYKLYYALPQELILRRRPGSQSEYVSNAELDSCRDPGLRRGTSLEGGWLQDPRHQNLGSILVTDTTIEITAPYDQYDQHRLRLGIPDGSRDMMPEKAILLENKIDQFNGISFDKGCYLGQELTARTHYRGLVRKHLTPVSITGPAPEFDAALKFGDKTVGHMRSSSGDVGLALLRQQDDNGLLPQGDMHCGETILRILT